MKIENPNISIVGAGNIGSAVASVLREKGIEPTLFDKLELSPENIKNSLELLKKSEIVFLCVHSWAMREVVTSILPGIADHTTIVSTTKGIERNTDLTMDTLIQSLLGPTHSFVMLSGPMLADEIVNKKGGAGALASKNSDALQKVFDIFYGTSLVVEKSDDVHGVVLSGVLKNIYAVLFGMAQGSGISENYMGLLTTRAVAEMGDVLLLLGAKKETAYSLAGIGDLVTTGFSKLSSNHARGVELATTGKISKDSEGISSLPAVLDLLSENHSKFKLICAVKEVVQNGVEPKKALQSLFK